MQLVNDLRGAENSAWFTSAIARHTISDSLSNAAFTFQLELVNNYSSVCFVADNNDDVITTRHANHTANGRSAE